MAYRALADLTEGNKLVGIISHVEELKDREADMFTTVFIGNSTTEMIGGKMVTKRGYVL